ncbi:MAG TPA: hypothetical protein VIZ43_21870, partial [Trebonia sp.]
MAYGDIDDLQSARTKAVPAPESTDARRKLARDLRLVCVLWQREMIRVRRSRFNLIMGLISPLLYLLILGTGL